MSADGRYVAFSGFTPNVPIDTLGVCDIFVHDRNTGVTTLISRNTDPPQHFICDFSFLSANGRYVAYRSFANNLVAGDTNGTGDIFVYDRNTDTTTLISRNTNGTQSNNHSSLSRSSLSADGRYVAFTSFASNLVTGDTNGVQDIFVHDRNTGITTRVSLNTDGTQSNSLSSSPSISADGRYVAFASPATNLVAGDTNGVQDVFVHDRNTGVTTLVSLNMDGSQGKNHSGGSSLSLDGRYVSLQVALLIW